MWVKRLLGTGCKGVSVEKLRAILGNKPRVNPTWEPEVKISIKAKEQLAGIAGLMQKTNYDGHYQQANNSIQ